MSIIQISKIQQRTGNIVDLPQLDEAEFGWASDTKQLFIGKTTPNENIEVLTSYSKINYDQLNGAVGNLNISSSTVGDGQVLTYDGTNWVNRGGNAGGLINLGTASNVKITGGAIGYVLETDGLGNLSWTPKSTVIAYIQNVTKANPAVVTTTQDNFFTEGQKITITNAQGMTQLNGNTYYVNVISSNSFSLYSDSGLITPVNSSGYSNYSYTSATATTASTNRVTVGNSAPFSLNQEVRFTGDLANSTLATDVSYFIKTKDAGNTWITVSEELLANGDAGNVKPLATATLSVANVYGVGGRAIAAVSGGSGNASAGGADGSVQYNKSNLIEGDANFVWDYNTNLLTITGNANVGNLNASGVITSTRYISNVATGTAPIQVVSTTRVSNLNVERANISDFGSVTNQTTGVFYPVFANSSATGNYQLGANANISFNAANGQLSATSITGNLTTASQPNITSLGTLTGLGVNGNITAANITANTGVFTGNASGLSQINASNLSTGTVPTARLSGNYTINVSGSSTTAGTVTTNAQPNITSVGTLTTLTVSGNANVGNIVAIGNVVGSNLTTAGVVSATGNVTGGNLITAGRLSVTGNVAFSGANISLGSVSNLKITGGTANALLQTDGAGNLTWATATSSFVHTQSSAATTWVVTHNLGVRYVNVQVIDTNGNSFTGRYNYPTITFNNTSALTVTFDSAQAGYVAVTSGGGSQGPQGLPGSAGGGIISNGLSNVSIATSGGNVTVSVGGTANVASFTQAGANVIGTINATGNISGTQLISTVSTGTAPLVVTSTTQVANLNAATAGAVTTAAQPNITSVGTLTSLGVNGTVTATEFTANTGVFTGNGSGLTALNASNITTGTIAAARVATLNQNTTGYAATVSTNAQPNITSVGTLTSLSVSGNANVGNIGATNFVGSGASLTDLNASNLASGTVPSARLSGTYSITVSGSATTAGTVTTNAQPNITSVGTLTSLGVTGNATAGNVYANLGTVGAASVLTTALTTGANTTAGAITGNWTLTAGSRLQATYADLAEYYEADDIYVPGTVVMFGGEKEVTLAEDGTNKVAGVVSTNPAYVMNATCPGLLTAVALQGRVPCKVRGKIKKGDMMISGGNGFARPEQFPTIGTVIGKALQDFDGYEGVIEVAVGRL